MSEAYFETLLNIHTTKEQKNFNQSVHYNRYEATPYLALDIFLKEYQIKPDDSIVDFGCGKGRLAFFANHFFSSAITGIEMNSEFYNICLKNKDSYYVNHKSSCSKINFINDFAQNYSINSNDNKFYFFNPFSVQIFMKVINNILISFEEFKRTIDIILYYPSDDYIYYLENNTPFELIGDVKIPELYNKNPKECFFIYRLI